MKNPIRKIKKIIPKTVEYGDDGIPTQMYDVLLSCGHTFENGTPLYKNVTQENWKDFVFYKVGRTKACEECGKLKKKS